MDALVKRLGELGVVATAHKRRDKRFRRIYITTAGMRVFAKNISRFCHPCMRYKLPVEFSSDPVYVPHPGPNYGVMSVISVKPATIDHERDKNKRDVYCLTVEDNHNFVAGGCVVQNCHHVSCKTIQAILNNSFKARMRFGGSASPWRDDGLDILIEACFGRRLCSVDASFLIEQGYLVKPCIMFNHFKSNFGTTENFNTHYTKYIVENQIRNEWIGKRAKFHVDKGRTTIILVKWTRHAELLAELIPGAEILTSTGDFKKSPLKRKAVLDRLRSKSLMCVIGTSLLDEGVDVPSAEVGIFAGTGKSSTRALQRVGRFIRKDKNNLAKDGAFIEEFYDHTMYLADHAKARKAILGTEKEFMIRDNKATLNPYYLEGGDITFDAFS
jgi:superfamily II DNA or RNA helicase